MICLCSKFCLSFLFFSFLYTVKWYGGRWDTMADGEEGRGSLMSIKVNTCFNHLTLLTLSLSPLSLSPFGPSGYMLRKQGTFVILF